MSETKFHPLDYVSLIRRRKWWMIVPLVVVLAGTLALSLLLPRVYRSHATLAVSSPKVTADLVSPSAPLSREERVRAISQQLLSRPVLERVAREEGLAPENRIDAAVEAMLAPGRIKVELTTLLKQMSNDRAPLDAFVLSYAAPNPEQSQRVTNRLANVFVEVTSRTREARAEDTSAFISTQLSASRQKLDAIEERLRKAKESYMGRLPEQTQANLSMAAGTTQQLESTAIALRGEQDRLSMIERQIEGMKQGSAELPLVRGGGLGAAAQRVLDLQRQLANARAMYTEKHPEIQRLQEELNKARIDAEAERARPEDERLASLTLDPAYRQLLADRERAQLRIRELQRAESRLRAQVASYQSRVEAAPMVEQQLASLQREYNLEKEQYAALSGKLQAAELAENLERRRGSEQFSVLYAAYLPRSPESPNIPRLWLIGVALGLALGAGGALGREYMDRSVHDVRGLQSEFDVPVLGEIPHIRRVA
jgi:polysaccharide chain length determinant protein (PEP-CTERM system associated)